MNKIKAPIYQIISKIKKSKKITQLRNLIYLRPRQSQQEQTLFLVIPCKPKELIINKHSLFN